MPITGSDGLCGGLMAVKTNYLTNIKRGAIMDCEIENCNEKARYFMYRINDNLSKDWIKVCWKCEGEIGDMNMKRQGYNPRNSLPLEVKK